MRCMRGAVYVNGTIARRGGRRSRVRSRVPVRRRHLRDAAHLQPGAVPLRPPRRRLRASAAHLALDVPFSDDAARSVDRDTMAAAGAMEEAYIRVLLTRGVGELTYDMRRDAGALAGDHRQAARRAAGARAHRRHHDLARADPAQSSGIGQPDHQVEQPAEQRARDAGSEPARRRRRADVQLPRRAVGVLAGELLHRARRRRADAGVRSRPARGHHARIPVRGRAGTSASTCASETLFPADLETADEAFITSTTRELSPVTRIDDRIDRQRQARAGHAEAPGGYRSARRPARDHRSREVSSATLHAPQIQRRNGAQAVAVRPAPMRFQADRAAISVALQRGDLSSPVDPHFAERPPRRLVALDHAVLGVHVNHPVGGQRCVAVGNGVSLRIEAFAGSQMTFSAG